MNIARRQWLVAGAASGLAVALPRLPFSGPLGAPAARSTRPTSSNSRIEATTFDASIR
jgi:hypothetical protein